MADERVRKVQGPHGGPRRGMPHEKVDHPWRITGRLLQFLFANYGVQMVVVIVCIFMAVYASVQGTMFTKTLIDGYITPMMGQQSPDYGPLAGAIAKVAGWYGLGVLAAFVQARVMVYVTQGSLNKLRVELFTHMESLPIRYFDQHSHGDIMSVYTNDIDTLRQMISQSIPQLLNSAITIVSVFAMMIVLSVPLTLVTMAMVAIMLILSSIATKISARNFAARQKGLGTLNGFIEETMSGEKVVKVFCHERESTEQFDELNDALFDVSYKAEAYSGILGPFSAQIGNCSYVLCAVVGCTLAINQYAGFTVGALASFLTFNKSFNMPINQVTQQFNSIISALAGAQRIFALLDEKPEEDDGYVTLVNARIRKRERAAVANDAPVCNEQTAQTAVNSGISAENGAEVRNEADPDLFDEGMTAAQAEEALASQYEITESKERTGQWAWKHVHQKDGSVTYVPLQGDVTFDHVDFGYTDEKIVLHDIVLHAKPGMKVALVGSTGAGKTTITNLINRFYDIQKGRIRFDHINIEKICKKDLRRSLGMVLQDTHLFTGSVKENIRFGRLDASDEDVVNAAKLAGADGFIRRLPQGYDTMLTGDGANLSQGQRQLLSIARAAIQDPPVLILDEATSSIDTRTERLVQAGMDRLMEGRTTFVIAHRLSTIRNADLILVMEQGRIIERGNHDELIAQKGRYYQLYTGKKAEAAG
jgi:ATP-binding cassette subfamily B multidrug efflux pump